MSFLTQIIIEAERSSAAEFMQALSHDAGLQAVMREEGLRAAMQAVSRQTLVRKPSSAHQDPSSPVRQEPVRQDPEPRVADSGRVVRVGGDLITNNSPGRPDITAIGRSRPTKPMQSGKSKIVPEPDQIQSAPPGPRRSSPLEPPGY